jgi:phosphate transport system protein
VVRDTYVAELDELRLQVEVMGVRVDANLERMRTVLRTGDPALAERAVAADDDIDAMNVSLTERCYDLLCREQPVASDLRLIVSVIRLIGELERIGDLSLRVTKLSPERPPLSDNPATFDVLCAVADDDVDRYRRSMRAWGDDDLAEAEALAAGSAIMDQQCNRLTTELLQVSGRESLPLALRTAEAGRALDRIGDHVTVIGSRLRYLLTGDPRHLAAEVR